MALGDLSNGGSILRIFADLHIHSKYSGATSERMNIPELVTFAEVKGLNLLGTGDALHPIWLSELRRDLEQTEGGLYKPKTGREIYFIPQVEVATIHEYEGKARRIHHVILMPSLDVAEQLSDELKKFGDIAVDGRPILNMHPAELIEIVMSLDNTNLVFPAHIWTPWWSIFGANGGVDKMEECYGEEVKRIHAIETGLSSDPPMNWRVSWLNKYTILSFSDSHSPYPYRLGREATVFELESLTYENLYDAIVEKRIGNRVELTIEVPPAYGKYHWSGHRKCGVGPLPPEEAKRMKYKCPVCGKMLTKGVDDRVEELADMPNGHRPEDAQDFTHLLPLQELIALSMGIASEMNLNSKKIWSIYEKLVNFFGSEFKVLL
ncbi:MAG: endonuclease Q family protein, partial [Nitrososphaerota archaeon]|nr:endonuclease Q family protein [Nitrososphaerota archaeon]